MRFSAPSDGPDLHSCLYPLQGLQDSRILRLEFSVHGNIFCRILAQENQCVAYMIGLVHSLRDLAHHFAFLLGTNALRCFDNRTGMKWPPPLMSIWFHQAVVLLLPMMSGTSKYNRDRRAASH